MKTLILAIALFVSMASMPALANAGKYATCAATATYANMKDEKQYYMTKLVQDVGVVDGPFYYGFAMGSFFSSLSKITPPPTDKAIIRQATRTYALKCMNRDI